MYHCGQFLDTNFEGAYYEPKTLNYVVVIFVPDCQKI